MTCLNVVATTSRAILIGTDSGAERYRRARRVWAGTTTKHHVIDRRGPIVVCGRGWVKFLGAFAFCLRCYFGITGRLPPPESIAEQATRWFRFLARLAGPGPALADVMQITICGFDRNRAPFIWEFDQTSRVTGFVFEPASYFIAPACPAARRRPRSIDGMLALLAAQVAVHRAADVTSGPPLEIITLQPGKIERQSFAELPKPAPRFGGGLVVTSSAL